MSRKFLDDHVRKFGSRSELPGANSTAYDAGHEFQDRVDGTIFRNEGTKQDGAIYGARLANRAEFVEVFNQRPQLNAVLALAVTDPADTPATADALRDDLVANAIPDIEAYAAAVAVANRDFEVLGTNMTSALATFADGGGITLTTAGADGDEAIVTPHLDTNQSSWAVTKWNTSDKVVFETNIETGANITNAIVLAGLKLTNTSVVATDNDQVFVRYEDDVASGVFQLITSASGTDTTTATTVTVALSTAYHVKIVVNGDRDVHLFINGVLAASVQAALTADVDLIPYVKVEADGAAAAKAINVRGIRMSKDLND